MKGVYLVTDRTLCGARGVTEVVAQAARAGACCVQLREKTASTRHFIDTAEKIRARLAPHRIPLIINDRVDVALAAGADGVHVGQSDMPPETARRLLGPDAIIGLSVETWEDVVAAQQLDVNYLGISPVFATPTKTDTGEPWGLGGIQRIKRFSRYPLVGIGGLNTSNAASVVRAGVDCVAVVSAICAAPDPFAATAQIKAIIESAYRERGVKNPTEISSTGN
jgi:thiamine-phosphate pyrophosphorylase